MASSVSQSTENHAPEQATWTQYLRDADDRMVKVGELALVADGAPLQCKAIGATVAVCISAPKAGLYGILHVGFPSSAKHRALAAAAPLVFADRGIAALANVLVEAGIDPSEVRIGIAGAGSLMDTRQSYDAPGRLLRAVEVALTTHRLAVHQRNVGGNRPQNVHQTSDGRVFVVVVGGRS